MEQLIDEIDKWRGGHQAMCPTDELSQGFRNLAMRDDRRLDLGRGEPVTGDVDRVMHAAMIQNQPSFFLRALWPTR